MKWPGKKYKTIYADPPWPERGGGKIKRGADRHYPLMRIEDIAALPVTDLADAESRQDNRREPGELAEKAEAGASCNPAVNPGSQDVAYTPQHLFNRPRQTRPAGRGEFADGSNVADPDVMHREQCRSLGRMGREGEPDQGDGRGQGPTQSGMGRNFDGPPAGLAGYRWPAGPGPQYPWEPPRIATGVKDRVEKLKALGDAVVPAQAYPIFRAIAEIVKCGNSVPPDLARVLVESNLPEMCGKTHRKEEGARQ